MTLIAIGLFFVSTVAWAGGGTESGTESTGDQTTAQAEFTGEYNEAPMLKSRVNSGDLPSVGERLPDKPLIYEAPNVGKYGGTLRIGHVSQNRSIDAMATISGNGERFMELSPDDYITPLPSVAEAWEFSGDYKTFTVHLRPGIKWSDGVPFTTDDVRFWWEDVVLNKELSASVNSDYRPGGEAMDLKIIDEHTFSVTFVVSYPTILLIWSQQRGAHPWLPAHYMKQFHPKYTDMTKIEELMKVEQDETWTSLYNRMNRAFPVSATNLNPDRPVLNPYVFVETTGNLSVFERNPYYWKVDTAGNQLPYIDRIEDTFMNREVLTMKIISGELDFVGDPADFADYTLYKENEQQGGYKVLRWKLTWATDISFMPNQTHIDPIMSEINSDKRFRYALSYSVNRDKINELVYLGLATPSQHTVQTPGYLYDDKYLKAHIEYDLEKANQLLDEMGLEWDKDGKFRLRPDGKTLTYIIPVVPELGTKMSGIVEIQKQEWEKVGIRVEIKEMTLDLFSQRIQNQEIDMGLWLGYPGVEISFYTYPRDYVPIQTTWSEWGSEWGRWYSTQGEAGIEPPDHIKELYTFYENMKTAVTVEERVDWARKILDSQAENLWCIGTVAQTPQPIIINEDLTNVAEAAYWTWEPSYAMISRPATWYFD